jgi:ABC-type nitrate/sulfonate/bicarbonate transport system substrate-binding protein
MFELSLRHGRIFATLIFAAATVAAIAARPATGNDVVRFGKGHPTAFTFVPVDVGVAAGTFAKHGIDMKVFSFHGAGKFHQGFAAGSIDMGAASGPDMVFVAKGSPVKAVFNEAGPPLNIGIGVAYDSPIKTVADLKGKSIGVTTKGSLTWWLPRHLAELQGWGADGVKTVSLTSTPGMIAGLRTKQVDAISTGIDSVFVLESKKQGRMLLSYGEYVKDFMVHVIYASNDFIAHHPDEVRKVLAGWVDTIKYMKGHKAEVVDIYYRVSKIPPEIGSRTYDTEMPIFNTDGHFIDSALQVLAKSYVEMGQVKKEPDMRALLTEKFLPSDKMN